MTSLHATSLDAVRTFIAATMFAEHSSISDQLGDVRLRPAQCHAAARLLQRIHTSRGALLADPVGVGKTFTALAVAHALDEKILIVAPAALRGMWRDALHRCGLDAVIVSHELLSRTGVLAGDGGLVIVDESHRVRSPNTRRYAALATRARYAKLLLLSATPLQNRRADLAAQLGIFLGRRAWAMRDEELATHVVRDTMSLADRRPRLDGPHLVALDVDDRCLDRLLALPSPVPAKDESIPAALVQHGLIHQWSSSQAALIAALKRRRARGMALTLAIEGGRLPSRAELQAWAHGDDTLQLAFPELVVGEAVDAVPSTVDLLVALDRHGAAVSALLHCLAHSPDTDAARANALHAIRARHPDERIIAFCQYAETVLALSRRMPDRAGIATLTARGARVAGGAISRSEVLRQFSPAGYTPHARHEIINLLITTDILSEGLNLQRASVVVHLDLPWNPARLDQRVGRALRFGSSHDHVTVYIVAPPAPAERLVGIERRLREKLDVARRTIGVAGHILPSSLHALAEDRPSPSLAEESSVVQNLLRGWQSSTQALSSSLLAAVRPSGALLSAAVHAPHRGFLALVRSAGHTTLIADVGAGIDDRPATIAKALSLCAGPASTSASAAAGSALAAITTWLAHRRGTSTVDLGAAIAARARRTALSRVAQALARAPRHRRAALVPLADAARAVATAPLSEGAERVLDTLICASLPDEAWLRSLATFSELNLNADARSSPVASNDDALLAVILFLPDPPAAPSSL